MKQFFLFAGVFFFTLLLMRNPALAQVGTQPSEPAVQLYNAKLNSSRMLFTENLGQVADAQGCLRPDVLFTAHSNSTKIFLTATSIHYQLEKTVFPEGYQPNERKAKSRETQALLREKIKTSTHHFTVSLMGANPAPVVRKEEQNEFTENFFVAHCPDGITGVHTYSRVVMENVYPGIDWVIYSSPARESMKYDFVVRPGANPSLIRLQVNDADKVSIAADGGLEMATSLGTVKEGAPVSYNGQHKIPTAFRMGADASFSFSVAAYNKSELLTIDPSVTWATYYGDVNDDQGQACIVDGSGNVYVSGYTTSTNGIAFGGFQNTSGGSYDAFLVKFSNTGSRLWATYYGGSSFDVSYACAVDGSGNVYLSGTTNSTSGIASGGFQNTYAGGNADAFLAKFSSTGNRIWATYYGGTDEDGCNFCAVDGGGNVYLAGGTKSTSGIASGGFQNTLGGDYDAFLVKFNSAGSRTWATYYGGSDKDIGWFCATDGSGNVYVNGYTRSTLGIASNGFQNIYGGGDADAYVVKFSSTGSRLWATYYGESDDDRAYSCTIDGSGNVYLAGATASTSGITSGGFQNTYGGGDHDAFLVKFSNTGSRLWATYYGGSGDEYGYSCFVNAAGNIFLVGDTQSTTDIASGGFQNTYGGGFEDVFIVKFNNVGIRQWASYYGGSDDEESGFCNTDATGNIYITGLTVSTDGIASGGFQNTFGGYVDAFVTKISDGMPLPLKLLSFTAQKAGTSRNQLDWKTAMETPGCRFEVEQSADSRRFATIAVLQGKNETGASYSVIDYAPLAPITYYRLKMTEQDGTITYSPVAAVRSDGKATITVGPVPSKNTVMVINTNAALNSSNASVFNMQGAEVFRFTFSGAVFIDVSSWAAGVYLLRMADNQVFRIVKE